MIFIGPVEFEKPVSFLVDPNLHHSSRENVRSTYKLACRHSQTTRGYLQIQHGRRIKKINLMFVHIQHRLHLYIHVFIFKNEFSLQEENCCLKERLEVTEAELNSRLARSQEVN
jgi:hypothetical protein